MEGNNMKVTSTDASSNVSPNISPPVISGMKLKDGIENKNISQITNLEKEMLPVSDKVIIEAIEKANRAIEGFAYTSFEYSIHPKTHVAMVKVIDRDTKEVIREIPPEKFQDLVAKLWELSGLVIDERR
jgi:flagellar protein FlaG